MKGRYTDLHGGTIWDQCRFTNQMWKCDVLGGLKLREIAQGTPAAAEIHNRFRPTREAKCRRKSGRGTDLGSSSTDSGNAWVGLFGAESVENPVAITWQTCKEAQKMNSSDNRPWPGNAR